MSSFQHTLHIKPIRDLLKDNLVDELHLFQSSIKIGKTGIPVILDKKIEDLEIKQVSIKKIRNDVYQHLKLN